MLTRRLFSHQAISLAQSDRLRRQRHDGYRFPHGAVGRKLPWKKGGVSFVDDAKARGIAYSKRFYLDRERILIPHGHQISDWPASLLETIAQPDSQGQKLLRDAAETMKLTARGYHHVLRVARTLADLDGAEKIGRLHLAEALSYRALADDLRRAA